MYCKNIHQAFSECPLAVSCSSPSRFASASFGRVIVSAPSCAQFACEPSTFCATKTCRQVLHRVMRVYAGASRDGGGRHAASVSDSSRPARDHVRWGCLGRLCRFDDSRAAAADACRFAARGPRRGRGIRREDGAARYDRLFHRPADFCARISQRDVAHAHGRAVDFR